MKRLALLATVLLLVSGPRPIQSAEPEYPYRVYLPVVQGACGEQVVSNGDFSSGLANWTTTGPVAFEGQAVRLGGYDWASDTIGQVVSVPSWAERTTVRFDWRLSSAESSIYPFPNDRLRLSLVDYRLVEVGSSEVWNTAPREAWQTAEFPLGNLTWARGHEATLVIHAITNGNDPTSWLVDNVTLTFCGPAW